MKLRRRCRCGAWIIWARDDDGDLVEVNPQAELDRTVPGAVVLYNESLLGDSVQRVSPLADFAVRYSAVWAGPVWRLHSETCTAADEPLGLVVSARGRRLLAILNGGGKKGGAA